VTAIMPVYNGEEFLEPALESLLAQDYPRFEVVVCDDGSTDRTAEILASYPSLRVVRQENLGVAAARNAALAESSGEFVAFFDADDLWPRARLAVQARYLLGHPETGSVLGRQHCLNPPPWLVRDAVYGDLGGIPAASAMVRRTVLDELGGFDPSFRTGEDTDLLIRMREREIGIAILPDILVYRRFRSGSLVSDPAAPRTIVRSLRQKLERERAGRPEPP
jgi:glycosyltransferase involved in cell wall biosynthesis